MKDFGSELFEKLENSLNESNELASRYKVIKSTLNAMLQFATKDFHLQFPDLFSKLVFVCEKYQITQKLRHDIQTVRKNLHLMMKNDLEVNELLFHLDLKSLCFFINELTQSGIPTSLLQELQKVEEPVSEYSTDKKDKYPLLRFLVMEIEDDGILGKSETLGDDMYKISFLKEDNPFEDSFKYIQVGQILHLLEVEIKNEHIHFDIIILEPDYLLDISAIAECIKDYSIHPYHFFMSQMSAKENSTPILLGNMANHFLDVFVHASQNEEISYQQTMKDIFKMYPFELSVNADLDDKTKRIQFFDNTKVQFENLRRIVKNTFQEQNIDVTNAVLEPSFICAQLGIQGRLDFLSMRPDKTVVIELKSGKAPFPENRYDLVADNHKAQLFLYQIVIQKVLQIPFQKIQSYLLYSRYEEPSANLRMVRPYMDGIKDILNMRNQIVGIIRKIVHDETYLEQVISHLSPELIANRPQVNSKFLINYIFPQILQFKSAFAQANPLELSYFYAFYQFVMKEQYIAKSGVTHYDQSLGHARVWLSDTEDKLDDGEILLDLQILENRTNESSPIIKLQIPDYEKDFLPNFRLGDIVILYERNDVLSNVTNRQIYRGSIIHIDHKEISIRLRNAQSNTTFLPMDSLYAVEHDFLDATFGSMFRGLYQFLNANEDRKSLLLHQRPLEVDTSVNLQVEEPIDSIREITLKAKQAKDYFLLLGPPGTGKTSVALKSMVKEFYADENNNILLLSYTNRAVDEICASISEIDPQIDFIRIGSEYSTDATYHHRLLQNVIKDYDKRDQVKDELMKCRIFVGTVASISGKSDLFKLKKFQVAIIDEASQILEPQIVGILTMKHRDGKNAIEKFVMIGDHKQLPAIVLQSPESSTIQKKELQEIGISDRRMSLFERLFRYVKEEKDSPHWSMLKKQGRMHPDIASFANLAFYDAQLTEVPTAHQVENLEWSQSEDDEISQKLSKHRVLFIPSKKVKSDTSFKINSDEVRIISLLLQKIWNLYQINGKLFNPQSSLGIITPYRSQIALIRKAIHELGIPELEKITIDTVERYQGSQRDIIIYSFCVNEKNQIRQLSNTFEEDGKCIDRKLNVALTRAKKQMFLIGNPDILKSHPIYHDMLKHYAHIATVIEPI